MGHCRQQNTEGVRMFGMLTEEAFSVQVLSSHFRPPPGQRAIVRLIAQVLSFYLCCRHVLEEEEARAPSPKDGRAGGGTKPAAARIGEAGMSAFLVNHSVPTQKAVDLVQRIYGPPGLSSSDQVSTIRHIRAQRRPVWRRCSSSNEQTLQSLRMRHAGRMASGHPQRCCPLLQAKVEIVELSHTTAEGHDMIEAHKLLLCLAEHFASSLRTYQVWHPRNTHTSALTQTRRTHGRTHACARSRSRSVSRSNRAHHDA